MQLIIFDVDGTLTQTNNLDDRCFKQALENTFNVKPEYLSWTEFSHVTDQCIAEEFIEQHTGRKATTNDIQTIQDNYRQIIEKEKEQINIIPGANEFLELLKNKEQTQIALATGCWKISASIKLDSVGIDYSDIPFGNSDGILSREDIVKSAIKLSEEKHQCTFDQMLYFGDGSWDFKTCNNLNIPLIGIDFEGTNKLQGLGVKHVFQDYSKPNEILASIDEILKSAIS